MLVNHKPELVGKFKIGFVNFAISELELAKDRGIISETEFKDYMHYVDLIEIGFDSHVPFLTDKILYRLINYKPLSELTGDEEWIQNDKARTKDPLFYNQRCPSVVKIGPFVYDLDNRGHVSSDGGETFQMRTNYCPKIEFPYFPKVDVRRVYIEPQWVNGDCIKDISGYPERIVKLRKLMKKAQDVLSLTVLKNMMSDYRKQYPTKDMIIGLELRNPGTGIPRVQHVRVLLNKDVEALDDSFLFYIWSGTTHMLGIKDFSTYGIEWRCWLFVPSEERLKNTPWEEC